MIEVSNLVKRFGDYTALDGLSMHINKGSIYGLVGPNGAGKSTVIRHLAGIYRADSGTVTLHGENIYENAAAKGKFAYIPDDFFYFSQATVLEMMKFYKGMYPTFDEKLFYHLQQYFPKLDLKSRIGRMSKGMQKQTAFWLSISCRPELLILDEPVDGLDPVMRRQIWNILLADVTEHETTVIVSSHNLRELEDVCDHVGILHKGKIIIERSLSDLQDNICKVQVAFKAGIPDFSNDFKVLHVSNTGRVYTMIVSGDQKSVRDKLNNYNPMLVDVLPLTLEEIFIYELGGADYEVKDIIL